MSSVPKIKLNNGYEIPALGLGTYKVVLTITFYLLHILREKFIFYYLGTWWRS